MTQLIAALPNGNPDLDPQQYINDESVLPDAQAWALDFLVTHLWLMITALIQSLNRPRPLPEQHQPIRQAPLVVDLTARQVWSLVARRR